MAFLFDKVKDAVKDVETKFKSAAQPIHSHIHTSDVCSDNDSHHLHRYQSFAPQREGNETKWYVDGCGYMWAVSMALENAQHSIWILDWWLSPELYLRRPPAKNEQYRLDNLLFAAAKRGVQVNIIVYKEVTQALTLSSSHTKHWLEDKDTTGNIRVFRHPDHLPDKQTLASSFMSSLKQSGMSPSKLVQLPGDAIKGIYGMNEDAVLFWAHHEKLCLIDGHVAFMGGLDLCYGKCYGRWDTNQHSISDVHPGDLSRIVFVGQDYNNARIMDFQDVQHWENNKLDRRYNSRMGWSDVAFCVKGPVVEDLKAHFVQRWNFIYYEKYDVRKDARYQPLVYSPVRAGIIGHPYRQAEGGAELEGDGQYLGFRERMKHQYEAGRAKLEDKRERVRDQLSSTQSEYPSGPLGGTHCQLTRSCAKWSHGVSIEHSIANAYIEVIKNSQHFVYMENQFFITATSDEQKPVKNRVGAAIVERILQAAKNNEDWHMIINIPSVPAFAGDLKADDALGTRAIMEFQYFSINRGGHSIMESVARAGVDPMKYLRFYNLRSYDRINVSAAMSKVEDQAGVSYGEARQGHDQRYGQEGQDSANQEGAYNKYQQAAQQVYGNTSDGLASGRWDSVADCYMLNGPDIRTIPWEGSPETEMDAFVSEELYIHSKLLIADDRVVICGSANMNDRSQLGDHDSEIAMIIEDPTQIDSYMAGRPWKASLFAASLRRQIFRKHLGLLPPQDYQKPDTNFTPVGAGANTYDWGSREDQAVADPLAPSFDALWKTTASNNTQAFGKVFHPVPDDSVQTWKDYDQYYERFFKPEEAKKEGKDLQRPSTWKWGHVVREEFSEGQKGLDEVKEILSRVKGNLVEMPLLFLQKEDIAKEGLGLNALTEEVYT